MPIVFQNIHSSCLSIICLASSVLLLIGAQKHDASRRQIDLLPNWVTSFDGFQQYDPQTPAFQASQSLAPQLGGDTRTLAQNQYTSIVVFGGSWADNAHPRPKRYAWTLKAPPYYQGRYSNGIIWAEYLSNSLLTGEKVTLHDYAYIYLMLVIGRLNGATVPFYISGRSESIKSLKYGHDAIKADSTLSMPDFLAKAFRRVDKQISELQDQVTKARRDISVNRLPCDFFIIPIPPLETVPTFASQASYLAKNSTTLARRYVQVIGEMSHRYNQGISRFVSEMQMTTNSLTSSGWVKTYDFERFWRDIIARWSQSQPAASNTPCLRNVSHTQVICSDPERYVYWDSLHPTTTIHKVIAQSLLPCYQSMKITFSCWSTICLLSN
ncbi:hypothetical protein DFH28DRAFT_1227778 [Melampsora americana]|nr:hypothetical protein DFH28DRAFT_1227778 [Melampsora americana]